ncbi:hypothetical protein D3C77_418660 [compost metagenome]
MRCEHARGADDRNPGLSVVQLLRLRLCIVLQGLQVDVQADHGYHLPVYDQRQGNAGHQPFGAGGVIEVGFKQAGFSALDRAGEEGVEGRTAGAFCGICQQFLIARYSL